MFSADTARLGKRVYKGVSKAPNRGTVKPGGYIQREMRNKAKSMVVGGDGMSDTRSGLAQTALRQQIAGRKAPPRPLGGVKKKPAAGAKPRVRTMITGATSGKAPNLNPPKAVPQLNINTNGTLQLPFDYQFSQDALNRTETANAELLDVQKEQQQQALSYAQNLRNASQGYSQQKLGSLNDFSGRGVLFSSGYGQQIGRDATAYNNQVNDLNAENTMLNNQFSDQRTQIQTDLKNFLRQQAGQQGVKLDADAGSLGYGKSTKSPIPVKATKTTKVIKPKPKPKPKPKAKKRSNPKPAPRPRRPRNTYALPSAGV